MISCTKNCKIPVKTRLRFSKSKFVTIFHCKKRRHFALFLSAIILSKKMIGTIQCMSLALASIQRDGQMKSESGKYATFWWTCYEIWGRVAIKGCQNTWGRRRIILNNIHGLVYIKRPDRRIIELNTSFTKAYVFMRKAHAEHVDSSGLVNVIRNVLRHAGSLLPCWGYHVLDLVLVFVCFCVFVAKVICAMCSTLCLWLCVSVFLVARTICAMCLTLCLCLCVSVFLLLGPSVPCV